MGKTPLKKVIKAKLKSNRELTEMEKLREKIKYEIAEELGLSEKIDKLGWSGLTAEETGRIGGIMTKRKKELHLPKNVDIQNNSYNEQSVLEIKREKKE
ncbi:small acid-soluble spore protein alpha/beta type [Clostridium pasteurianum DSM 525 = ATCC 6013]|uniref:Small acid-soluble spore protein alpha/beta type n=1 Tax=Clostridium pasteurianum DSM 525 = ATCC 6013 TaxID=1262449 RepID=A0A0H3J4C7_CLOPA|nr:small, acid-soluble spore protein, alpha/beta type [Clostridium pasteurianum]AJA47737.1 small acid-soluble spore protein alpha/beta type [Clostridium pasteurianum DSM 525 = ATCC 6013]AJA51725.1 small acid-soluble spore protein alpha/beta type [Clostridium pasteurianum DSM 525 = ATCC 6013]AOZ75036.1 benzoate transporter [Clostridium pasteurianum DSM 525 = ATCC 6013]AOZ78831.1 benzoate transporter [Clostridium pasteurianum]ELP59639.1 small acid-soluble spore protein alpha/beta type [Clostridi